MTLRSSVGPMAESLSHFLLASLAILLMPAIVLAQEGDCGVAADHFNVDGQFYSVDGLFDWVQGSAGSAVFFDDGSRRLSPSLHARDPHWEGGAIDSDVFDGSGNKNNDDISPGMEPWTWAPGSGPSKNDLTDVLAYSKEIDGDIWFFLGAMTRATNGASHIDFEFNQRGFTRLGETSGTIVGNGPDAGRTADVDFIVSVDYTSGGTVPVVSFRVWQQVRDGYEFVLATADPNDVFVCTNNQIVPAPPWGAIAPDGTASSVIAPYQFVEIAVNLTNLGIDKSVFCTDASTLLFKTRSAPSFTASLKDLALYKFSIIEPPVCTISADASALCEGESTTLYAPAPPVGALYSYLWSGPGVDGATTTSVTASVPGIYTLTVTDESNGCSSTSCEFELVVHAPPTCAIDADTDVICAGESASFCGPEPPPGSFYSYSWEGPGGPYPDARCITVTEEGVYSLTVTDVDTGCVSTTCQRVLTVNDRPFGSIEGPALICQGEKAQLCGPEGNYVYTWTGPKGYFASGRCVEATVTGSYQLVLSDPATGCQSDPITHELVVADNPVCTIEGPDSVCPGGSVLLCGPEGELSYTWVFPDGSRRSGRCVEASAPGTYSLTVENQNGCTSTCQYTLGLDENVAAAQMEDVKACTGQSAELCVTATGTEPITYQWSKDGQIIHGATEACYAIDRVKASDVGEYTVEVSGKCGEPVTRSASLTLVDVTVQLSSTYWCEGQTARICAEVSGEGPFLYEWARNGAVIAGATAECLVLENVTEFDEGEYSVTVTGYCGVPTTATAELYVGGCEQYCSLTQGFYGNAGGKRNGMSTLELLDMLIPPDDPLVVGVVGDRSIQFPDGSEHCIIDFLPGGATPAVLDPSLGDLMVNPSNCEFMGIETPGTSGPDIIAQGKLGTSLIDRGLLLNDEGRLRNNLLSQTLTLSLNVRLDPNLSDMPICQQMIMIAALPGPDGLYGTEDDVPDNDNPRFAEFSEAILRSLDDLGLPRTAGGILELANQALVGNLRRFGVTAGDVTGAVGSINDIADHCAMLIHCADSHDRIPGRIGDVASKGLAPGSEFEEVAPSSFAFRILSRNPLPRGEGVQVSFAIPELSRVRVQVFDLRGRRVSEMPERMLNSGLHAIGINLQGSGRLPSGVYFLRMDAVGLLTGRQFANTQKVMLLP